MDATDSAATPGPGATDSTRTASTATPGTAAALVTGAASGLGAATVAALLDLGDVVYGLDLPASWERAGADRPEGLIPLEADVTDVAQVQAAIGRIREEAAQAGADAGLRHVVNCAGIGTPGRVLGRQGPHDMEVFERVIRVNLVGTFSVLAHAAELMAGNEPDQDGCRGVVVNTASVAAFDGQVGQAAYAASKGGVHSLTLSAARDLASRGIRVMTIAPGTIDTPMMAGITPEFRAELEAQVQFPPRLGTPEEYARLVGMILDHPYLNGETIRMDGALRMPPR